MSGRCLRRNIIPAWLRKPNADNTLTADIANYEQAEFRAEIEWIYDKLTKAKMRLDGK